jgi:hypothetical protein
MPQHDLDIANGAGNVVRADINAALVALGTHQKGPTAPAGPAAGWIWIDDNTPSATLWTVFIYDGAAWIPIGYLDTTNDRWHSIGAPIWAGTAGGTANALTITTTPAPARFPGLIYSFLAASANTGAVTLNDNAIGAVAIRRPDNVALLPNDMMPGDVVQVVWDGSLWRMTDWPEAYVREDRRVASASAQIDIALPTGFTRFRLEFDSVRPVTDAAALIMRTSIDNGATFASAASDYNQTLDTSRPGSSSVTSATALSAHITLSAQMDTANTGVSINGTVDFFIGDGTRQPWFNVQSSTLEDSVAALTRLGVVGLRASATPINAIRLLMTSGNISIGTFRLYGVR